MTRWINNEKQTERGVLSVGFNSATFYPYIQTDRRVNIITDAEATNYELKLFATKWYKKYYMRFRKDVVMEELVAVMDELWSYKKHNIADLDSLSANETRRVIKAYYRRTVGDMRLYHKGYRLLKRLHPACLCMGSRTLARAMLDAYDQYKAWYKDRNGAWVLQMPECELKTIHSNTHLVSTTKTYIVVCSDISLADRKALAMQTYRRLF